MGDGLGQSQLAPEPFPGEPLSGRRRPDELERDRLSELAVDCLVHVPHASGPHLLDDRVAVSEELAGCELGRRRGAAGLGGTRGRRAQLGDGGRLRGGRAGETGWTERPIGHCLGATLNAGHLRNGRGQTTPRRPSRQPSAGGV